MKRDPFQGKIREQYIGYTVFSIAFVSILYFVLGVAFILMVVLTTNQPLGVLIAFPIVAAICFAHALIYVFVGPIVIRSYPKHRKLAHVMFRSFIFEDGKIRIDDIYAFVTGERTLPKGITPENVCGEIAFHVPSKKIKQYIAEHKDLFGIMHLATLANKYIGSRKAECFEALVSQASNPFEKNLLELAARDFATKKRTSEETNAFYEINDPRGANKPVAPFLEVCPLPILLKKGDIVRYKAGRKTKHAVIGGVPESGSCRDFSDQAYLAYKLDGIPDGKDLLLGEHIHLHICEVNKTQSRMLTEEEMANYQRIVANLKLS